MKLELDDIKFIFSQILIAVFEGTSIQNKNMGGEEN